MTKDVITRLQELVHLGTVLSEVVMHVDKVVMHMDKTSCSSCARMMKQWAVAIKVNAQAVQCMTKTVLKLLHNIKVHWLLHNEHCCVALLVLPICAALQSVGCIQQVEMMDNMRVSIREACTASVTMRGEQEQEPEPCHAVVSASRRKAQPRRRRLVAK